MIFRALLEKDLKNSARSLGPCIFLGLPLILILSFFRESFKAHDIHWLAAFWLSLYIGLSALFYRSFGFEHASSFLLYTSLKIKPRLIFWSQALAHWLVSVAMACSYLFIVFILWSPSDAPLLNLILIAALSSLVLCPLGSLLGLMIQAEREFIFSLLFFPLSTPVILASLELSLHWDSAWLYVLGIFAALSCFLCSFIFEFFFDELT